MKRLKKLYELIQEITVRRWPPVYPTLPAQDFTLGYYVDGSPVVWPSRQLDFPDAWLCVTVGTHAVEICMEYTADVEWHDSAINAAVRFAENAIRDLEETWRARLNIGDIAELEKQANALLLSGLIRPDWRPGFNLLAPAVWALRRLDRDWSGNDVRRAALCALQGGLRFSGVSVFFNYDHRPATTQFFVADNLSVQFLGTWDSARVSVVLSIGQDDQEFICDFTQDVLSNVVAGVCRLPYEVTALAETANQLYAFLEGR
jgi:hypothetical protein